MLVQTKRTWSTQWVLIVDYIARPVRRLEEFPLTGIESQRECLNRDLELQCTCGADDRDVVVRFARDPGRCHVRAAYATARRDLGHAARDLTIDLIAIETLARIVGGARSRAGITRKKPPRQRTEGREGDEALGFPGQIRRLDFGLAELVLVRWRWKGSIKWSGRSLL